MKHPHPCQYDSSDSMDPAADVCTCPKYSFKSQIQPMPQFPTVEDKLKEIEDRIGTNEMITAALSLSVAWLVGFFLSR